MITVNNRAGEVPERERQRPFERVAANYESLRTTDEAPVQDPSAGA